MYVLLFVKNETLFGTFFKFRLKSHHPFTHEQATPSGDFLEKNHENLS